MSRGRCIVSSGESRDRWLRGEWNREELAHSEGCDGCAALVASWRQAEGDLGAARAATEAANLDLTADILRQARQAAPQKRRWPWLLVPAAVACAALLFYLRSHGPESVRLHVHAAGEALRVLPEGSERPLPAEGRVFSVPTRIRTGADGSATVRVGLSRIEVAPDSDVEVNKRALALRAGEIRLHTAANAVRASAARIELYGRADISVFGEHEERKMNKKLAAGSAVVAAVALYSGYAVVKSDSESRTLSAPTGAKISESGKITTFPLGDTKVAAASRGSVFGGSPGEAADDDARLGARWDEASKSVVFAVPGEVFDGDSGQPIPSFRVIASAMESRGFDQSEPKIVEVSDKEGHFLIEGLGFATWSLRFESQGYAPVTTQISLVDYNSDPYVAIGMTEGASLSGQVVDWRGRPVKDAAVGLRKCVGEDGEARPECSSAKTNADGMFHLPRLPEEEVFSVYAHHPRYGNAMVYDQKRVAGETSHVVVTLSGVVRIHGRVTSGAEARPVAGAAVVVEGGDSAFTDGAGHYEILAPLEEYPQAYVDTVGGEPIGRVTAHPENRSTWPMQWIDAPTHVAEVNIDFQLAMENGGLSGTVTSQGAPVVGAEMRFHNTTGWTKRDHESYPTYATTDAGGRYRLKNVPVASGYLVEMRAPDEEEWRRIGYVSVPDDAPVQANFELGGGRIRGMLIDPNGEAFRFPSEDCRDFAALSLERGYYRRARCYPDGRFEVVDSAPGRYRLEHRAEWMKGNLEYEATEVKVGPGAIADGVEVTVRGEGTEKWIFRVLDESGRFVTRPYLRRVRGDHTITENLRMGEDGTAVGSVGRSFESVFIDAAGYQSEEVSLSGRDPAEVIEVRMKKVP